MVSQTLVDYVKAQLKKGVSENKLRGVLANSNWTDSDIDEAFNLVKAELQVPKKPEEKSSEGVSRKTSSKKKILYILGGIIGFIIIISIFYSGPSDEKTAETKENAGAQEPVHPEPEQITPEQSENLDASITKMNVYLENNKFKEAKGALLEAKLQLADIESKKELSETETKATKELLNAMDDLIDASELMNKKDFLTLKPYATMIEKFTEARNHFAEAHNIGGGEGEFDLTENIKDMDSALAQLNSDEMLKTVIINSYMSKIDTESVRDLAIEIVKNNCGIILTECETDDEKAEALYNYVRDNIMYVRDPNGFSYKSLDYIQDPSMTIQRKAGDCDDHAVLLNSLFESVGISSAFCFGDTTGKTFDIFAMDHAFSTFLKDNQYIYADGVCKETPIGTTCFPEITTACFPVAEFKQQMDQIISET